MLTLRELSRLLVLLSESLDNKPLSFGPEREPTFIGLMQTGLIIELGGVTLFIGSNYFDVLGLKDTTLQLQEIGPGYYECRGLLTKSTTAQLSLLDGMIASESLDTSRK